MAAVCRQTSVWPGPFCRSLTLYIAATLYRVRATSVGATGRNSIVIKNTPDAPINLEENLVRVSELLRCAAATAYETCDQLTGQKRDLACSVMHLVEMAQGLVERSLTSVEVR